jgi:TDG/mug DNA glycosylase family protein
VTAPWRPSPEEIEAAFGRSIPDVVGPGLRVLFCGVNPSLYSGAIGHHFAGPGNRFWKALHGSEFTDRLLSAFENRELLKANIGVTNLVNRATRTEKDLSREELREGAGRLERLVDRNKPRWVAVVGIGAYEKAFGRPGVRPGPQRDRLAGAPLWVLPNPSGLNAWYPLSVLIEQFRLLREASAEPEDG